MNGLSGQAGQTSYAAAKAGVIGFTKSLALEAASRNITVNAVAPGYTDTAMVSAVRPEVMEQILKAVPAGQLATPAEIARGVVFLAADDAGFITGRHDVDQWRQVPGVIAKKSSVCIMGAADDGQAACLRATPTSGLA